MRPSRVAASFRTTNGRPVRRWCRYGASCSVTASARDADGRRRCRRRGGGRCPGRRRAASGSSMPTTTRATPASTRASAHGPVRPVVAARLEGDGDRGARGRRAGGPGGVEGDDLGVAAAGRLGGAVEDAAVDGRRARRRPTGWATVRHRGCAVAALASGPAASELVVAIGAISGAGRRRGGRGRGARRRARRRGTPARRSTSPGRLSDEALADRAGHAGGRGGRAGWPGASPRPGPGASPLDARRAVPSGVRSRGPKPVPPVVTTRPAKPSVSSRERGGDAVDPVGDDPALDDVEAGRRRAPPRRRRRSGPRGCRRRRRRTR